MWSKHPKVARKWTDKYGSKPVKQKSANTPSNLGYATGIKLAAGLPLNLTDPKLLTQAGIMALASGGIGASLGFLSNKAFSTPDFPVSYLQQREVLSQLDNSINEVHSRLALNVKRKNI